MTRRQKKRFIFFAGCLVSVICAGMLIGTVYAWNLEEKMQDSPQNAKEDEELNLPDVRNEEELEETLVHIEEPKETEEAKETEEHLPDDWNLILVNQTHLVPEDYQVELKEIGDGHQIDARAYEDFRAMIKAARADGVTVYVTSSYRDMDKQTELHENKIEALVLEGYSYAEAKELAAQVVAVPGTSEHQLGLALDFVSAEYRKLDEKQEQTKGFRWLKEHCQEYGFILRYPNGKTDVTGIIYEPWHFRYVGKEAAEVIMKAGITLEEYLGAEPVSSGKKEESEL